MKDGRSFHDLDLHVAADAGELGALMDRVEAFAAAASLPEEVAARLALICEEWAANVVEHGAGATRLRLSVRSSDAVLHIVAEDDGPPFDPLTAPMPDLAAALDERRAGGLGLHLMRRVARELRYERVGSVNRLALVLELGS